MPHEVTVTSVAGAADVLPSSRALSRFPSVHDAFGEVYGTRWHHESWESGSG
jgi:hypothetical protein